MVTAKKWWMAKVGQELPSPVAPLAACSGSKVSGEPWAKFQPLGQMECSNHGPGGACSSPLLDR